MSSQPPPRPPVTSNRLPPVTTADGSTQKLSDKETLTRSALRTLLQDTNWPDKLEDVAQKLVQTINNLPDLPQDVTPIRDTVEELIRVLGNAHASLKEASDRYGRKEGGVVDGIMHVIPSRRRGKWTDTLQTCRSDTEKLSTTLRSRLESLAPIEHLTGQQASVQNPSPDLPEDQKKRSPIRDGALTAFRKTFKTVDAVSGAIPGVGNYVGAAAKVGLALVNTIETMDKNEDAAKELASHTSKLSEYLERIKQNSVAEQGDDLAARVDDLHGELEKIQKKVSRWSSMGLFKKALLASDHAGELKGYQGTAQTVLEEMQLLVSLKTSDLVIEIKDTELRVERRRLLDRLGDGSYGARGNSIEDVVCLPGTRVEILGRIDQWIKDTSASAERVMWIRGMAGRGKSTIASTVAHSWASRGSCAIFHFRRGQNASDGQFICALARQLGKGLVPEVKNAILGVVRENEDIAKERLDQQFKILLVGSLDKLKAYPHPIIIIVDALDECKNVDDAESFVRLIDQHFALLPTNVKFLLTCRPEAPLLEALKPMKWREEDLDSIPISHVSEDVNMYIQHSFAQIRKKRHLSEDWPPSADVKRMVEMSQGLFQWARTSITYIGERAPVERLQGLLQHESTWGKLDYLYHQILSRAFDEAESSTRKQLLSWVLETLVAAPYPVSLEIIAFLHTDHKSFKGQVDAVQFLRNEVLADLNSLLHIPLSPCEPLRLMHTSIRDLLASQERCKSQEYFVDLIQAHRRLASVSLVIMERDLRKNICELSDISKANSEVQDAVESHVPKGLRYCCRSWSIHLATGLPWPETNEAPSSGVLSSFRMVSEEKLLAWLEVMSLIGATNEAFTVAKQVHQWLEQWPPETFSGGLITLWNDTRRFIASSLEPISFSALHIYASALPHCPVETKLWAKYGGQATTRILHGERRINWSANIWTSSVQSLTTKFSPDGRVLACGLRNGIVRLLDAQTGGSVGNYLPGTRLGKLSPDGQVLASASGGGAVQLWDARTGSQLGGPLTGTVSWRSVVFSPDGKVLASGCEDKTVRLWDARTGAQLGDPLAGHTGFIMSVVFSPDGKVLASGSEDKAVRLWDARTGAQLGDPSTGHTHTIHSLVFSPDSKILASGSEDGAVRFLDARTGAQLGDPLTGHKVRGWSVVFSPDGKVLAFASEDQTVRLWDVQSGVQLGDPLTGHTDSISSLVFSPDSKILASVSSFNRSVRLWDVQTGAQLGEPLTGRTDSIRSIVFSPDGKVLVSASWDDTVRFSDARTGTELGDRLTSRTRSINSVVFSPDGMVLASASEDNTLRIWDAQSGAQLGDPLTGHTSFITSIVFSPDGKALASASLGHTIRLWDARTGAQLGDPLSGHTSLITSSVFSPDGKVLASASWDKTVRLWDARTGAQLGHPLTGHAKGIWSIVFSPDSKVLASASEDRTIRLWDARAGAQMGDPLTAHTDSISSVVFSTDGKVLASGSEDKTIRLWDVQSGIQLGDPLTGHTDSIISLVFSLDSKVLASVSEDNTVRLWDAQSGAQLGDPLTGHTGFIMSVVFSPDGKVLASASSDKTVRLWDAQPGAQLGHHLTSPKPSITSVFRSPDRTVLVSVSSDNMARLWDIRTGIQVGDPLTGHTDSIRNVFFSPDSRVLASVSSDKTVRLWDVQNGAQLGDPLTSHQGSIDSVVFSPDGKALASWSSDNMVRLWDARTGAQLGDPLSGHTHPISSVVFSPDSKVLAFVSRDKTVQLRDARTGTQLGDPLTAHTDSISSAVFSPDSKILASVLEDGAVRFWDARTGAQLGDPLTGHTRPVWSFVFSPDSNVLASTSSDKTIRLWDVQSGIQLGDPLTGHTDSIISLVFSPDSKILASESLHGTARSVQLWDVQTGAQLGDPLTSSTFTGSVLFSPDSKVLAFEAGWFNPDKTVRLWDARTGAQLGDPLTGRTHSISSIIFSSHTVSSPDSTIRPWDSLTSQTSTGPLNIFTVHDLRLESNWVLCDSKRLFWLPIHYRSMNQYSTPEIIFSHGRLAVVSESKLCIIDVSEFSGST